MNESNMTDVSIDSRAAIEGPDWRWKTAKRRAYESSSRNPAKDNTVQRVTSLLRIEDGKQVRGLPSDYEAWVSAFRQARAIRYASRDRIVLESMLLSPCDSDEIEALTTISSDVQAVYEACFFDIGRRTFGNYPNVGSVVELPEGGKQDLLRAAILRLVGYGGRVMALACVDYLNHCDDKHDLSTKIGLQRREIELMVQAESLTFGNNPIQYTSPVACVKLQATLDRIREKRVHLPKVSDLMRKRFEDAYVENPSAFEQPDQRVREGTHQRNATSFGTETPLGKKIA